LIAVQDYVPDDSTDPALDLRGATQLVGTFLSWLVARDHLSDECRQRTPALSGVDPFDAAAIEGVLDTEFGGQINASDMSATVGPFCASYLGANSGFASDFHDLFVEGTDLKSFAHVNLRASDRRRAIELVDWRFSRFQAKDPNWLYVKPERPQPHALSPEFSPEEWSSHLRSFADLGATPAGRYKARVREYWQAVDAAMGHPVAPVARALLATYTWQIDTAVQESVWRVLKAFPIAVVAPSLVAMASELAASGDWLPTLVDIFPESASDADMKLLFSAIDNASPDNRVAYLAAMRSAERGGSKHCADLLRLMDAKQDGGTQT
jgi:hypothetical protein